MSGAYGSSYIRFLPSNYFSEKIETDQIQIGKGPSVFKNYWKLKNTISKITLKPIIMRARTENAIAHFKKSSRSPFPDSREQNKKNECVSTDVIQKLTPLLLHWNLHTCAPIKNTDSLNDHTKKIEKKSKFDPSEMNDHLWPREMESPKSYTKNGTDKMSPIPSSSKHQRAKVRK